MSRAARWVRQVWSWAPCLGLVPRPEARPNGVTAMVRVRGEEEWLEPCLRSVEPLADEILVLDNGAAPGARAAVEGLRDHLGDRLRVESCQDLDLFQLSNAGLEKSRFRWVIRWDADFVAHTSGAGDVRRLRRYLLDLDRRRYYLVYLPAAELAGDLRHQFPDRRIRRDGQAHVASETARYVPVRQALSQSTLAFPDTVLRPGPVLQITLESLWVPKYYRVLDWPEIVYFHVNVKSARRMLLGHFWLEWLGRGDFGRFPTLEGYALAESHARWGAADLDEAAHFFITHYCRGLAPVDLERSGPYPDVLAPHLERPRYRVEYQNGAIVGRAEAA